MKKNKATFFMVLFFFIGLMVLLYPSISDYTNKKLQSKAINNYEEVLKNSEVVDYDAYFEKAISYNKKLASTFMPLINYKNIEDPTNILSVNNDGMIGYITIDKIRVELPIYYGTTDEILNTSVGILEGSSLPAGSIGMNSILSAHRGLPSSKLFTDLDKLEIGDTFTIKVLNKTMTYEIDNIEIVEPNKVDSLAISNDLENITLMTCTPYGINSHRLLLKSHRTENTKVKSYISTDAFKVDKTIVTPLACLPIIFVWLLIILLKPIKNNKNFINKYVYPNNNNQKVIKPSSDFRNEDIFNKYVYPSGKYI